MKYFLDRLTDDFEKNSYNPISAQYVKEEIIDPDESIKVVLKTTPFLKALDFALERSKGVAAYLMDIKSALLYIGIAARYYQYDKLSIYDIQVDHICNILEYCLGNSIN